jgi:hypothetical protein
MPPGPGPAPSGSAQSPAPVQPTRARATTSRVLASCVPNAVRFRAAKQAQRNRVYLVTSSLTDTSTPAPRRCVSRPGVRLLHNALRVG